ncbi:hypothetical protein DK44_4205 [Bacillus atrophaeus]|nr:hypothetical protein DK44_4205 [Bacillus atrophaeus]
MLLIRRLLYRFKTLFLLVVFFQKLCQLLDRRLFKQHFNRNVLMKLLLDFGRHHHRFKRMAADRKEIVGNSGFCAENPFPNVC